MEAQNEKCKAQSYNQKVKTELKYRCYYFSIELIKFLGSFQDYRFYRSIFEQVLRSGTGVGANVVEAKSASSRRDFIRFYEYALKSANETKYWLSLLWYIKTETREKCEALLQEVKEISNMIASSLLTMKKK